MRPKLDQLWLNFPDHVKYPTLEDLHTWLGGAAAKNIHVPGFGPNGNTCAARLSVAFDKSGARTRPSGKYETIGTADGSRIIFRVNGFRQFLLGTLGKPSIDETTPFHSNFSGKKGIIAFNASGWSDA